jgi:hypothetical protein
MLPRRGDVVEPDGEERAVRVADLVRFRRDLYGCFPRRADALFELGDALLCAAGPVASPVDLSVEPEFRRGHGSVYDALRDGRVDDARLRRLLTGSLDQARAGEPLMFGIDVSPLPRPDTRYADALSMVQVRGAGDPWPLVMFDSGYSGSELAYKLAGEQVAVLVRVRCDRVFRAEPGVRRPGRGRPPRHGARLECAKPQAHPVPDETIAAWSGRYGNVVVRAWHRMHQALHRGVAWAEFPEDRDVPILPGTLIQVRVERLPHGGAVKPLWLWHTGPPGAEPDVDLVWKAYLRRFDQEHFHRFAKVYLGLDRARLQSARAADRWISLVVAGYAQLRLTAPLVADEPKPWQRRTAPGVLPTPCRTRAGFRRLRAALGTPAGAAKNTRPGPGRPKGRKNRPKPRQPVYRKTDKTPTPKQQKATAPP